MPRIFNTIRQRLLKENRFTRYLVYAVGEIVLVVIGILIALQVNTWNLARQDRKMEAKYLAGLKADLQVDLVNLEVFIADRNSKAASAMLLLKLQDPITLVEVQVMDSLIWRVFAWRKFVPSTKTMDELIGSGNLSLIKNDSIKATMLDVAQKYSDIAVYIEHMRREYDHYLYDRSAAMREMMPFTDLDRWVTTDSLVKDVIANERRAAILRDQCHALLQDLTFRNGLKLAAMNNHLMQRRSTRTFKEVEHLIVLIDKDLNEH
ncbi:MAG: hypothetical protein IPJ85_04465 [Flavobacteriales bacterium]|nr:hypothetical protein [Flavobacteriales bacterium]